MSYFQKVADYQTYSGSESDFHYDFNANSGGGQAFLGGKIAKSDGKALSPHDFDGLNASFELCIRDQLISLSSNSEGVYPISPRGAGSPSMKLGVQGKINPNNLISAALMLPKVCGRNMASSINVSPLTADNFWLRSMWLDAYINDVGDVVFIPKDFVFEGGLSKRNGVTQRKDAVDGTSQFFKLDSRKRIEDIIALADEPSLPGYAQNILQHFRDIYLGQKDYDYQECSSEVAELMRVLSQEYCESYSGYSDPLNFLLEICGHQSDTPGAICAKSNDIKEPHNLIYFGAPGTGKSFELRENAEKYFAENNVRRVTFHPDYTYAQFVGCYKPSIEPVIDNESDPSEVKYSPTEIEYKFIPGPFIDTYVDAIRHPEQNYLLIIEEINRANPAAVFGDVFQLLDRNDEYKSEYPVTTSEDLRWYLFKQWKSYLNGVKPEERKGVLYSLNDPEAEKLASSMSLPSNMYIWATMNSADQGVFPMDTAFKRRWEFRYIGINDGSSKIEDIVVPLGDTGRSVKWNDFRSRINDLLLKAGINEDKLLGPFFISPSQLRDPAHFTQAFMDKVLLYLFEDAAKAKKPKVFRSEDNVTYSSICGDFKSSGEFVFKDMEQLPEIDGQPAVDTEAADGQNDDGE